MAKFNALLQSLARPPAFQQGLFDAARGIGATPVMLGAQRQAEQRRQEIQDSLRQNANNPEALEQFANQYLMQGREDVAKAFSNAAEAARRRKEREAAALSEKGEMALFNMARMMQSAPDEDISRNSLKRQNYLSIAEGYGVGPERALQILDQSVDKGSDAKGYKVEKDIEIDGKLIAVADFFDAEGNFLRRREIGPVPEKTGAESDTGSELKNPVEQELIKRTREGESAVREFNNSSRLQQQLLDGSIELTPGVIGGIRTRAYEIAGIQDEEESVKRDFIRARNTEIINSLPPGIASDTDIRVFSAGFPSDNANQETVLRFLAAQKRIFSAAADMGTLYDDHITQQINDGVKSPTTAGFYSKKMAYGNAIAILETNIQRDPNNAQKYLGDFQKAFGFIPLFYR
jgi:hypothetical protein